MTVKTANKYTPAMIQAITAAAAVGPLNLARCTELSTQPEFEAADITPRMIVAKVRSMGVAYENQVRVSKTGEPVASKADIVAEVAAVLGVNLDDVKSLDKAEKAALRKLADAVKAAVAVSEDA
jgi:hypothetical protein